MFQDIANFSIVMAMVLSYLDYANSLVFECLVSNVAKLQHIQNTTAHVVLDTQHPCQPSSCSVICTGCLFTSASITEYAL